ncbi:MAG TPA: hypothetical protein VL175_10700 [Pirellulales bacterium]|jgi:hypothetical protein|nr:hypothetical protein [Pirellulales bacterium]
MVPKKQVRIEFGSPAMLRAWVDGLETYDPTLRGRRIDEEGGVTEASINALRKIVKAIGRQPDAIIVGPEGGCLFTFGDHGCYLATGFNPGHGGEGGWGLIDIAAEFGFGTREECRDIAGDWSHGQQGVMYAKTADYGAVYQREMQSI